MRRNIPFWAHATTLLAAVVCLTAADDVQVIRSPHSTFFIYSYGGAEPSRILPEFRDAGRPHRRNAGKLTDVVSIPPLSVSAPPVKSSTSSTPAPTSATPAPKRMAAQTSSFGSMSAPSSAPPPPTESAPELLPILRTVTVGWNASPEPSVAGYHVYVGNSSGQYTDRTAVGNQTSAQVEVGQSALYIAVSAYTAEGLESPLSNELIILAENMEAASASGGLQVLSSSTH